MRVGFLVGDIVNISGGSNVIIEHAVGLRDRGHDVVLIPLTEPAESGHWHPKLANLSIIPLDDCRDLEFDFLFATWWLTWFDLHQLQARVYGYFNQSYESRFHPERHYKLQNRVTYSLPLFFVTEARWLEQFITTLQPDARVRYVRNGLSREYFPLRRQEKPKAGPLKVVVEGPWAVPFKGVPESFSLLELAARDVRLDVTWLTSNSDGKKPKVAGRTVRVIERVPISTVANVLHNHDVMLKLSTVEGMYGPPLEMFSQGGTAITTPVSGCDEYLVHGHNGLLAPSSDVTSVVRYLRQLSAHPEFLEKLRTNAFQTASAWPDWTTATGAFSDALEEAVRDGYSNAHLRGALASTSAMRSHWLDDRWNMERRENALPNLGKGESLLLERYRKLKETRAVQTLKQLFPPAARALVRASAVKVLR